MDDLEDEQWRQYDALEDRKQPMSFRDHRHEDVEPAAIPDSPHTPPRLSLTAKRALAIGAAVLAVVIIIVVVAFTLHTQSASQPSAASIDGPMPASPARDLVLSQADFPQAGGTFTAGPDRWATPPSDSFLTMNSGSPLCRRLLTTANTGPAIDQQTASMDFSDGRYSAKVKKIADPSYDKDLDTIIAQCRNFSFTVDGGGRSPKLGPGSSWVVRRDQLISHVTGWARCVHPAAYSAGVL